MPHRRLRFLSLAVKLGKINEATRAFILKEQRRRRLVGEHHARAGDLLVENKILDQSNVDDILDKQNPKRENDLLTQQAEIPQQASTLWWQLVLAFVAIVAVVIAIFKAPERVELTIVVVSFVTYVLGIIAQLWAGRTLPHAVQRAALPLVALIALCLVIFAVVSILTMKHDHQVPDPGERERVRTITVAFSAMTAAVIILLIYSIWKFHALRFAESRLGATKDVLIRVESVLRDDRISIEERRHKAIQTVLKGLRNTIRLSPSDRILRLMSPFLPSFNQTRVLYFVPDVSMGGFRICDASYPEGVTDKVLEAFEWIRTHHKPVFLNEKEFERQKEIAKGISPKEWKKIYLNMPDRDQFISVCGWIYDKQETLIASNASTCLALDTSYLSKMEDVGFDSKVLEWLAVGSFVGCRIVGSAGEPAGVLLAIKNTNKGFPPEDLEVVITASQILGRILQTT
jgi:hypothetical protein